MMTKIYLFWLAGLIALTIAGSYLLPLLANSSLGAVGPGKNFSYVLSLAQWDGGHYLDIADNGYISEENYAFFPLYPLLVKVTSYLTLGNTLIAALLLSNIFFAIFIYKLYHYTTRALNAKKARNTILTFLLFPTTFFCIVAYSESLFLLLAILCLESIASKNTFRAAIFAGFATFTRLVGLGLTLSLFLTSTKSRLKDYINRVLFALISSIGLITFSLFSYFKTGDPLKFISVQNLWQRQITDPLTTINGYLDSIVTLQERPINDYFDLFLTLAFFTILVLGIKKIPLALWIFSMFALLVPTYSGTLTSIPRYLLCSIGVFLIVGDFLEQKPQLKLPLWSIMLALQCVLAALFINGHWIA